MTGFLLLLFCCCCQEQKEKYVCQPCGLACDTLVFAKAGICPHCNMKLIKKSELTQEAELVLNEINIARGSGVFLIEGGEGKKDKTIKVYYHQPNSYTKNSKILIVVPGAGRNGDSYRDAWIAASEKYDVLILSPMYSEQQYGFEDYQMCGLIKNSNLYESIEYIENSNMVKLREADFSFQVNSKHKEWIFRDFDRLFERVVNASQSAQTQYDIFGHSAGGQILHRLALFHPHSKANRILASNSGFYTATDFNLELPFGLKNTPLIADSLKHSFAKKLILFIGELDNQDEKGGTLLRSNTVDQQGLHRLDRAKFFYSLAENKAKEMQSTFNWQLKVIPNIGHNQEKMAKAAAEYLYEEKE